MHPSTSIDPDIFKRFPYNWATGFPWFTSASTYQGQLQSFSQFPYNNINHFHNQNFIHCQLVNEPIFKINSGTPIMKIQEKQELQQSLIKDKKRMNKVKNKIHQTLKSSQQANFHIHPKPSVKHQVKYYDPSSAPSITSSNYNQILRIPANELQLLSNPFAKNVSQLDYNESDDSKFITFKFRRMKKKYRRFLKEKINIDSQGGDSSSSSLNYGSKNSKEIENLQSQNQFKRNCQAVRSQQRFQSSNIDRLSQNRNDSQKLDDIYDC